MKDFLKNTSYKTIISYAIGFFVVFSWTDFAPIDGLIIFVGLITLIRIIRACDFAWIWSKKHNVFLLCFSTLILSQFILTPAHDAFAAGVTLYLASLFFLAQYWHAHNPSLIKTFIYGYLSGAVFSSILGLIAYVLRIITPTNVILPLFWGTDVRMAGFFDDPVVYGVFLVPALLLLFHRFIASTLVWERLSLAGLQFCLFVNLVLTGSRGAWLNAFVAATVFIIVAREFHTKVGIRTIVCSAITGIAVALLIIHSPIRDGESFYAITLSTRDQSSDMPRIVNWEGAPERLKKRSASNIWIGSGTGMYKEHSVNQLAAHNEYLTILYEQGIIGLSLWVGFLLSLLYTLGKEACKTRDSFKLLLISLILGFLIHSFFVDTLHWRHFFIMLSLV